MLRKVALILFINIYLVRQMKFRKYINKRRMKMKLGIFIGSACLDIVYYQDELPLENKKLRTNNYNLYGAEKIY